MVYLSSRTVSKNTARGNRSTDDSAGPPVIKHMLTAVPGKMDTIHRGKGDRGR
jgi:hypothetical protein